MLAGHSSQPQKSFPFSIDLQVMASKSLPKTGEPIFHPCLQTIANPRYRTTLAILSVYNKTGLLDLAKGLIKHNVRILASGGTANLIREAGFEVE